MSSATLAPLLALPLELKYEIISHLCDGNDPESKLALMLLRRTHSLFRQLITRKQCLTQGYMIAKQLFLAERNYPMLFLPGMRPCYYCKRLLLGFEFVFQRSFEVFTCDEQKIPFGADDAMGRQCVQCRLKLLLGHVQE